MLFTYIHKFITIRRNFTVWLIVSLISFSTGCFSPQKDDTPNKDRRTIEIVKSEINLDLVDLKAITITLTGNPANVHVTKEDKDTKEILSSACENGRVDVLEFLDSQDKNFIAHYANFLLKNACKYDRVDVAEFLLKKGVNISQLIKNENFLFLACESGSVKLVEFFIEQGANISELTKDGSVLSEACGRGYIGIVKLLVENGADVNKTPGSTKQAPLYQACDGNFVAIMDYLIKNGADTTVLTIQFPNTPNAVWNACRNNYLEIIKLLVKNKVDIVTLKPGYEKGTLLHKACQLGYTAIVQELVKFIQNSPSIHEPLVAVVLPDEFSTMSIQNYFASCCTEAMLYNQLEVVKELINSCNLTLDTFVGSELTVDDYAMKYGMQSIIRQYVLEKSSK